MNKKSTPQHRLPMRLTALVTAFVFMATSVNWQTPALAESVAATPLPAVPAISPDKISIPAELGALRLASLGTRSSGLVKTGMLSESRVPSPESRFVILIQDAHAVLDAQENIRKILAYLNNTYGIRDAALEGAKGRLEPVLLRTFPEPSVKRKVLAGYEKRAELSGPELASVMQEGSGDYFGMENWALYERNYAAYLVAQDKKDALLAAWKKARETLDRERVKVYDEKLNEFHAQWEGFLTERNSLMDLMLYLTSFQSLLGPVKTPALANPKPGFSQGYTELPQLIKSIGYEKTGKQEALAPLVRKIADDFKTQYLRSLGVKTEMNFYNRYQAFVTGQIQAGEMLQYLIKTGAEHGKQPKLTPALKTLLGHTETLSELKGSALYDELERFLPEVQASLVRNGEQAALAEKFRHLYLLKDLIGLELTHDQLAKYRSGSPSQDPVFASFEQDLAPALEFYQAALDRDQAFYENIMKTLKEKNRGLGTRDSGLEKSEGRGTRDDSRATNAVAVVAGGFHTNGLERILREKRIPYAVITPKISSLEGHENYFKVMKGEVSFKDYIKTTYFDALMRHAAKAMTEAVPIQDRTRVLKTWRDNVIRELARQGRITEASKFLPYIDELLTSYGEPAATGLGKSKDEILASVRKELEKFKNDSLDRIWKTFEYQLGVFTEGLRDLIAKKQLTTENISSLLERASASKPSMLCPQLPLGSINIGSVADRVRSESSQSEPSFSTDEIFPERMSRIPTREDRINLREYVRLCGDVRRDDLASMKPAYKKLREILASGLFTDEQRMGIEYQRLVDQTDDQNALKRLREGKLSRAYNFYSERVMTQWFAAMMLIETVEGGIDAITPSLLKELHRIAYKGTPQVYYELRRIRQWAKERGISEWEKNSLLEKAIMLETIDEQFKLGLISEEKRDRLMSDPEVLRGTFWHEISQGMTVEEAQEFHDTRLNGQFRRDPLDQLKHDITELRVPGLSVSDIAKSLPLFSQEELKLLTWNPGFADNGDFRNLNPYLRVLSLEPYLKEGETYLADGEIPEEGKKIQPEWKEETKGKYHGKAYYGHIIFNEVEQVEANVRSAFNAFLNDLRSARNEDEQLDLTIAFQKKLVFIHPFLDGNGRSTRLLCDFILRQLGLPPSLHPNKNDMFDAIEQARAFQLDGMLDYLTAYRDLAQDTMSAHEEQRLHATARSEARELPDWITSETRFDPRQGGEYSRELMDWIGDDRRLALDWTQGDALMTLEERKQMLLQGGLIRTGGMRILDRIPQIASLVLGIRPKGAEPFDRWMAFLLTPLASACVGLAWGALAPYAAAAGLVSLIVQFRRLSYWPYAMQNPRPWIVLWAGLSYSWQSFLDRLRNGSPNTEMSPSQQLISFIDLGHPARPIAMSAVILHEVIGHALLKDPSESMAVLIEFLGTLEILIRKSGARSWTELKPLLLASGLRVPMLLDWFASEMETVQTLMEHSEALDVASHESLSPAGFESGRLWPFFRDAVRAGSKYGTYHHEQIRGIRMAAVALDLYFRDRNAGATLQEALDRSWEYARRIRQGESEPDARAAVLGKIPPPAPRSEARELGNALSEDLLPAFTALTAGNSGPMTGLGFRVGREAVLDDLGASPLAIIPTPATILHSAKGGMHRRSILFEPDMIRNLVLPELASNVDDLNARFASEKNDAFHYLVHRNDHPPKRARAFYASRPVSLGENTGVEIVFGDDGFDDEDAVLDPRQGLLTGYSTESRRESGRPRGLGLPAVAKAITSSDDGVVAGSPDMSGRGFLTIESPAGGFLVLPGMDFENDPSAIIQFTGGRMPKGTIFRMFRFEKPLTRPQSEMIETWLREHYALAGNGQRIAVKRAARSEARLEISRRSFLRTALVVGAGASLAGPVAALDLEAIQNLPVLKPRDSLRAYYDPKALEAFFSGVFTDLMVANMKSDPDPKTLKELEQKVRRAIPQTYSAQNRAAPGFLSAFSGPRDKTLLRLIEEMIQRMQKLRRLSRGRDFGTLAQEGDARKVDEVLARQRTDSKWMKRWNEFGLAFDLMFEEKKDFTDTEPISFVMSVHKIVDRIEAVLADHAHPEKTFRNESMLVRSITPYRAKDSNWVAYYSPRYNRAVVLSEALGQAVCDVMHNTLFAQVGLLEKLAREDLKSMGITETDLREVEQLRASMEALRTARDEKTAIRLDLELSRFRSYRAVKDALLRGVVAHEFMHQFDEQAGMKISENLLYFGEARAYAATFAWVSQGMRILLASTLSRMEDENEPEDANKTGRRLLIRRVLEDMKLTDRARASAQSSPTSTERSRLLDEISDAPESVRQAFLKILSNSRVLLPDDAKEGVRDVPDIPKDKFSFTITGTIRSEGRTAQAQGGASFASPVKRGVKERIGDFPVEIREPVREMLRTASFVHISIDHLRVKHHGEFHANYSRIMSALQSGILGKAADAREKIDRWFQESLKSRPDLAGRLVIEAVKAGVFDNDADAREKIDRCFQELLRSNPYLAGQLVIEAVTAEVFDNDADAREKIDRCFQELLKSHPYLAGQLVIEAVKAGVLDKDAESMQRIAVSLRISSRNNADLTLYRDLQDLAFGPPGDPDGDQQRLVFSEISEQIRKDSLITASMERDFYDKDASWFESVASGVKDLKRTLGPRAGSRLPLITEIAAWLEVLAPGTLKEISRNDVWSDAFLRASPETLSSLFLWRQTLGAERIKDQILNVLTLPEIALADKDFTSPQSLADALLSKMRKGPWSHELYHVTLAVVAAVPLRERSAYQEDAIQIMLEKAPEHEENVPFSWLRELKDGLPPDAYFTAVRLAYIAGVFNSEPAVRDFITRFARRFAPAPVIDSPAPGLENPLELLRFGDRNYLELLPENDREGRPVFRIRKRFDLAKEMSSDDAAARGEGGLGFYAEEYGLRALAAASGGRVCFVSARIVEKFGQKYGEVVYETDHRMFIYPSDDLRGIPKEELIRNYRESLLLGMGQIYSLLAQGKVQSVITLLMHAAKGDDQRPFLSVPPETLERHGAKFEGGAARPIRNLAGFMKHTNIRLGIGILDGEHVMNATPELFHDSVFELVLTFIYGGVRNGLSDEEILELFTGIRYQVSRETGAEKIPLFARDGLLRLIQAVRGNANEIRSQEYLDFQKEITAMPYLAVPSALYSGEDEYRVAAPVPRVPFAKKREPDARSGSTDALQPASVGLWTPSAANRRGSLIVPATGDDFSTAVIGKIVTGTMIASASGAGFAAAAAGAPQSALMPGASSAARFRSEARDTENLDAEAGAIARNLTEKAAERGLKPSGEDIYNITTLEGPMAQLIWGELRRYDPDFEKMPDNEDWQNLGEKRTRLAAIQGRVAEMIDNPQEMPNSESQETGPATKSLAETLDEAGLLGEGQRYVSIDPRTGNADFDIPGIEVVTTDIAGLGELRGLFRSLASMYENGRADGPVTVYIRQKEQDFEKTKPQDRPLIRDWFNQLGRQSGVRVAETGWGSRDLKSDVPAHRNYPPDVFSFSVTSTAPQPQVQFETAPKSVTVLENVKTARSETRILGLYLTAENYEKETGNIRGFPQVESIDRFFLQLAREFAAFPGPLTDEEILSLFKMKIQWLEHGEPSVADRLRALGQAIVADPPSDPDFDEFREGLSSGDFDTILRFFSQKALDLYRVIKELRVEGGESVLTLGGDAEKLSLGIRLVHPDADVHFLPLSRASMISSPQMAETLQNTRSKVIDRKSGYTKRINGPQPPDTPGKIWSDNSLIYSVLFEAMTLAREQALRDGAPFEAHLREILFEEWNHQAIQESRIREGRLVHFGNPNAELAAELKEAIARDDFFRHSMSLFERFYDEALKQSDRLLIFDLGVRGIQAWLFYGLLEYLKHMTPSDPHWAILSDTQKALVLDLQSKRDQKRIRIALFHRAGMVDALWKDVPRENVLTISGMEREPGDLIEFFRSFKFTPDFNTGNMISQPNSGVHEEFAYLLALIMRNVFLAQEQGAASQIPAGVNFLPEDKSVFDPEIRRNLAEKFGADRVVAFDFDKTVSDYDPAEDRFVLRPGIIADIKALRSQGVRVVLMSGTYRLRLKLFFSQYPEMSDMFDVVIPRENFRGEDLDNHEQAVSAYPGLDPQTVQRFYSGDASAQKDPFLVGADLLIDDNPNVSNQLSVLRGNSIRDRILLVPPFNAATESPERTTSLADPILERLDILPHDRSETRSEQENVTPPGKAVAQGSGSIEKGLQDIWHEESRKLFRNILEIALAKGVLANGWEAQEFLEYLKNSIYKPNQTDAPRVLGVIEQFIEQGIMTRENNANLQRWVLELIQHEERGAYGKFHAFRFLNTALATRHPLTAQSIGELLAAVDKILIRSRSDAHDVLEYLTDLFQKSASTEAAPAILDPSRLNRMATVELQRRIERGGIWRAYASLAAAGILSTENIQDAEALLTEAIPEHLYVPGYPGYVPSDGYEAVIQWQEAGALTDSNIPAVARIFRDTGDRAYRKIHSSRTGSLLAEFGRSRAVNTSNLDRIETVLNFVIDQAAKTKNADEFADDLKLLMNDTNRLLDTGTVDRVRMMPLYFADADALKNILWLNNLLSRQKLAPILAQTLRDHRAGQKPVKALYRHVWQALALKPKDFNNAPETLKAVAVRRMLMSKRIEHVWDAASATHRLTVGPVIPGETGPQLSAEDGEMKRSWARTVELAEFDEAGEDQLILRAGDTEKLVVSFTDADLPASAQAKKTAEALAQADGLKKMLLLRRLTGSPASLRVGPLVQYMMQLEWLHLSGILKGRIFYPSMGNDFLPAYFGTLYATNLYSGLGPDLRTGLAGANVERALHMYDHSTLDQLKTEAALETGFSQTWLDQPTDIHLFWENNFNFAAWEPEVAKQGPVDTVIIKGVTPWLEYYEKEHSMMGMTKERAMRVFFDHLSAGDPNGEGPSRGNPLIKPGAAIVILDIRDEWMEETLRRSYGCRPIRNLPPYKELANDLDSMPVKETQYMFGNVNTHLGLRPITILIAPGQSTEEEGQPTTPADRRAETRGQDPWMEERLGEWTGIRGRMDELLAKEPGAFRKPSATDALQKAAGEVQGFVEKTLREWQDMGTDDTLAQTRTPAVLAMLREVRDRVLGLHLKIFDAKLHDTLVLLRNFPVGPPLISSELNAALNHYEAAVSADSRRNKKLKSIQPRPVGEDNVHLIYLGVLSGETGFTEPAQAVGEGLLRWKRDVHANAEERSGFRQAHLSLVGNAGLAHPAPERFVRNAWLSQQHGENIFWFEKNPDVKWALLGLSKDGSMVYFYEVESRIIVAISMTIWPNPLNKGEPFIESMMRQVKQAPGTVDLRDGAVINPNIFKALQIASGEIARAKQSNAPGIIEAESPQPARTAVERSWQTLRAQETAQRSDQRMLDAAKEEISDLMAGGEPDAASHILDEIAKAPGSSQELFEFILRSAAHPDRSGFSDLLYAQLTGRILSLANRRGDLSFFEIFKNFFDIHFDLSADHTAPSTATIKISVAGEAQLTPEDRSLFFDRTNRTALIKMARLMRQMFPFDERFQETDLPPLQDAVQSGRIFSLAGNLEYSPMTESYRRHVILDRTNGREIEIKIPGDDTEHRRHISSKHFDIPEKFREEGLGDLSPEALFFVDDEGINIAGLKYEDGRRIEKITPEQWRAIAARLSLDVTELLQSVCYDILRAVDRLHRKHWSGSAPDDFALHLTNFRLIEKEKTARTKSVGDVEIFHKAGMLDSGVLGEERAMVIQNLKTLFSWRLTEAQIDAIAQTVRADLESGKTSRSEARDLEDRINKVPASQWPKDRDFDPAALARKVGVLMDGDYGPLVRDFVRKTVNEMTLPPAQGRGTPQTGKILGLAGMISGVYHAVVEKGDTLQKINFVVPPGIKEFDTVSARTVSEFKFHLTLRKLFQQVIGIGSTTMPHLTVMTANKDYRQIPELEYFGEADAGFVVRAVTAFLKERPGIMPAINLTSKGMSATFSLEEMRAFLRSDEVQKIARQESIHYTLGPRRIDLRPIDQLISQNSKLKITIGVSHADPADIRNLRTFLASVSQRKAGLPEGRAETRIVPRVNAPSLSDVRREAIDMWARSQKVALAIRNAVPKIRINGKQGNSYVLTAYDAGYRVDRVTSGVPVRQNEYGNGLVVHYPESDFFKMNEAVIPHPESPLLEVGGYLETRNQGEGLYGAFIRALKPEFEKNRASFVLRIGNFPLLYALAESLRALPGPRTEAWKKEALPVLEFILENREEFLKIQNEPWFGRSFPLRQNPPQALRPWLEKRNILKQGLIRELRQDPGLAAQIVDTARTNPLVKPLLEEIGAGELRLAVTDTLSWDGSPRAEITIFYTPHTSLSAPDTGIGAETRIAAVLERLTGKDRAGLVATALSLLFAKPDDKSQVNGLRDRLLKQGREGLTLADSGMIDAITALESELAQYKTEKDLRDYVQSAAFADRARDAFKEFAAAEDIEELVQSIVATVRGDDLQALLDESGLIMSKVAPAESRKITEKTRAIEDLISGLPTQQPGETALTVITDLPDSRDTRYIFEMFKLLTIGRLMLLHRKDQKIGRGVPVPFSNRAYDPMDPARSKASVAKKAIADLSNVQGSKNLVAFWSKDFDTSGVNVFSIIAEIGRLENDDLKALACTAIRYLFLKYASLSGEDQAGMDPEELSKELVAQLNKLDLGATITLKGSVLTFNMQALSDLFTARQSIEQAA